MQTVNEHGDPAQRFYIQKSETFTITYNSNENNSVITHQTKSNLIDIVLSTNIPIRDGYKFTGWNTKVDGTGITYNPGAIYTENNNLVLYAQWERSEPYIEAYVKKSNGVYAVEVVPHNIEYSNDIIVASYIDGRLVTFERREYLEDVSKFTVVGNIDEIKAMVWNALSGLKPLCEAKVIPSSEFIVE